VGLHDGPVVLLDGGTYRCGEVAEAVICANVRREGDGYCQEDAFEQAHGNSLMGTNRFGDTTFRGGAPGTR
jgi:hypothetical protein